MCFLCHTIDDGTDFSLSSKDQIEYSTLTPKSLNSRKASWPLVVASIWSVSLLNSCCKKSKTERIFYMILTTSFKRMIFYMWMIIHDGKLLPSDKIAIVKISSRVALSSSGKISRFLRHVGCLFRFLLKELFIKYCMETTQSGGSQKSSYLKTVNRKCKQTSPICWDNEISESYEVLETPYTPDAQLDLYW